MKPSIKTKVLAALLTIVAAVAGHSAWAVNTFTVTNSDNTFTITRTETTTAQTVKYRTVSLSAMAGKNFTAASGELTFAVGESKKTVTVTETAQESVELLYRFQNTYTRGYTFEVLDMNGFRLASANRSYGLGNKYRFDNAYVNSHGTLLVKWDNMANPPTRLSNMSKFVDVKYNPSSNSSHVMSDGYVTIDDGYNYGSKTLCNISTTDLFSAMRNSEQTASVTQAYQKAIGNKMYATVCFTMKEVNDGYQYIQILADNNSTYDETIDDGAGVTKPSTALYRACFELSKGDQHGNNTYPGTVKTDHYMNLPIQAEHYSPDELEYVDSYIWDQKYKSADYSDQQSGAVVVDPSVNQINVRFDAGGENNDTWCFKDLFVRLAMVDHKAPYAKTSDIVVSSGPYHKANPVTVSVPFSEIVTVTGTPTLSTSWGTLNYVDGSGTNVLSFRGPITADASTKLTVNSLSGTVKDLIGNDLSGSVSRTNFSSTYTSTAHYVMTDENTVISGLSADPYIDDGTNHPAITVTFYQGTTPITLTEGTDYERTYVKGETTNGITTMTFTLTGTGNYEGSFQRAFTFRTVSISDFTPHPTAEKTYLIITKEDLGHLAALNDKAHFDCTGYTFLQTADIVCDNNFVTISRTNAFKGTYDGQGNSISGINIIATDSYYGLFGQIGTSGTVQNLVLKNSTIKANNHVGAIAALCRGTIKNCRVESSVTIGGSQYGCDHAGGIAGSCYDGTIEGCLSAAKFTDADKGSSSNNTYFGGIVCLAYMNATVKNCLYTGNDISSNHKSSIVQRIESNTTPTITNNYYTDSSMPGGVCGADQDGGCLGLTITLSVGIGIGGEASEYNVSSLTAYADNVLQYDGVVYSSKDHTVTITATEEYRAISTASYNDGEKNHTITPQQGVFSFTMPDANVTVSALLTDTHVIFTMNEYGIMTYANSHSLDFKDVDDLTVSYASAFTSNSDNTGMLTMTKVNGTVRAGTGLMLKGTPNKQYIIPVYPYQGTTLHPNLLVGLSGATTVSKKQTINNEEYTTFILANGTYGINWYVLDEDSYTLKANSAYLRLKSTDVGLARQIVMSFDEASSISEEIRVESGESAAAQWYTVDGVKLDKAPTKKGLYVSGGKKVVIK